MKKEIISKTKEYQTTIQFNDDEIKGVKELLNAGIMNDICHLFQAVINGGSYDFNSWDKYEQIDNYKDIINKLGFHILKRLYQDAYDDGLNYHLDIYAHAIVDNNLVVGYDIKPTKDIISVTMYVCDDTTDVDELEFIKAIDEIIECDGFDIFSDVFMNGYLRDDFKAFEDSNYNDLRYEAQTPIIHKFINNILDGAKWQFISVSKKALVYTIKVKVNNG